MLSKLAEIKNWFNNLAGIKKIIVAVVAAFVCIFLLEGKSKTGSGNILDNAYSKDRDQIIGKHVLLEGYARVHIMGMSEPGGTKTVQNIPPGREIIVIKDHFDKNTNKLYYQVLDTENANAKPAWTEYSDITSVKEYDIIKQANYRSNIVTSKQDKDGRDGEFKTAPSNKGLAIRAVASGERFLILDAVNSSLSGVWYEVRSLETGGIGWIHADHLSF